MPHSVASLRVNLPVTLSPPNLRMKALSGGRCLRFSSKFKMSASDDCLIKVQALVGLKIGKFEISNLGSTNVPYVRPSCD